MPDSRRTRFGHAGWLPRPGGVAFAPGALRIANILIIRFDGIGDAAILAPLVAGLRTAGHRLDIVLSDRSDGVFAAGTFDTTFAVGWGTWKTSHVTRDFGPLLRDVRERAYDWALIPTEELAAYRLAHAAGIPHRRGFTNGWEKPLKSAYARMLCTDTLHRPASLREPLHEARVQYRLATGLGASPEPSRDIDVLQRLFLDDVVTRGAAVALQITPKWERIGVSGEALGALVARLQETHHVRVLAARQDFALATALDAQHVDLFDDLRSWKIAIASAAMVVTPDTGAAHIAGMLGTPVVDCFPAEDFALQSARWAPWAAPSELVAIERRREPVAQILGAIESVRR